MPESCGCADLVRSWASEHPGNASWVEDVHHIADRLQDAHARSSAGWDGSFETLLDHAAEPKRGKYEQVTDAVHKLLARSDRLSSENRDLRRKLDEMSELASRRQSELLYLRGEVEDFFALREGHDKHDNG